MLQPVKIGKNASWYSKSGSTFPYWHKICRYSRRTAVTCAIFLMPKLEKKKWKMIVKRFVIIRKPYDFLLSGVEGIKKQRCHSNHVLFVYMIIFNRDNGLKQIQRDTVKVYSDLVVCQRKWIFQATLFPFFARQHFFFKEEQPNKIKDTWLYYLLYITYHSSKELSVKSIKSPSKPVFITN